MTREIDPEEAAGTALLLRGATVLDGTGALARREDVRIAAGRIVARAGHLPPEGATVLDLSHHYLAPGFVDVHSHSDLTVLANPGLESKVFQGITTEVVGNCGSSPFPIAPEHRDALREYVDGFFPGVSDRHPWDWSGLAGWAERVDAVRPSINLAPLVGHGSVRIAVAGLRNGLLSSGEAHEALAHVEEALQEGAFGFSTGLAYSPELRTEPSSLEPFVRATARHGGVYATHMRDEAAQVESSVDESIALARLTGCRLEISHVKCFGRAQWGGMGRLLDRLDAARRAGLPVRADAYPYEAAETGLSAILPGWAIEGSAGAMMARLGDPSIRERIRGEILAGVPGWSIGPRSLEWRGIVIAAVASRADHPYLGRNLVEIAASLGRDPLDIALDLLVAEHGAVSVLMFGMEPKDVRLAISSPSVFLGTDAIGNSLLNGPLIGPIHPRAYGTFPRFLAEEGADPRALAAAVARITALPSDHFGLSGRGRILPGQVADLVAWPVGGIDRGPEYGEAPRYSALFQAVWVGGEPVLWDGELTGRRPGRVLRRSAERGASETL